MSDFAAKVNSKLKKPKSTKKGPFCDLSDQVTYLMKPARQINVHNASTNRNRKSAIDSQVYRYEALAAGQSFAGVIVAQPEVDLTKLELLLGDEMMVMVLGGSHTGGYGRVVVSDIQEESNWEEYTPEEAIPETVIITLLSDTILRSPSGQLSTELAVALGVNQKLLNSNDYRAYQRIRVVGGWNRKWGLPLPQAWALQAGSVFRFPAAAVDEVALQAFVERGIGERRAEGFGRIALNWHTQATRKRSKIEKARASGELPPLSARSKVLALRMANRRLRAKLEEGLVDAISRQAEEFKNLPSTSQLSSVRLVARQAWQENDLTVIVRHLESLKGAKADWQKARIGRRSQSLFEWVKKQCPLSEHDFNANFGLTGGLPAMAAVESEVTDELHVEFCARLVEAVMKLAIEEAKKERGG
jgi:CRISPR-associated protein Csx10